MKLNKKRRHRGECTELFQAEASVPLRRIEVYFDGGCKPNPGTGYGSYEVTGGGYQHRASRIVFGSPMTNNIAEYHALIHGLKKLWHDVRAGNVKEGDASLDFKQIELAIFSDSTLLVNQVAGRWKCKVAHIKELKAEVIELVSQFGIFNVHWKGRAANVERFGH